MPIVHPFIQNIQPQTTHSLATVSSCPVDVMASATSCTTVTTTTTTAVIGSNASLIRGNPKSCADAFGNGVLEISPLSQQKTYRGDVKITSSSNTEHEVRMLFVFIFFIFRLILFNIFYLILFYFI